MTDGHKLAIMSILYLVVILTAICAMPVSNGTRQQLDEHDGHKFDDAWQANPMNPLSPYYRR